MNKWLYVGPLTILLGVSLMLFGLELKQQKTTAAEPIDESVYVGTADGSNEIRRIDDLEKGVSCYQSYRGLSCVHTGDYGENTPYP